ncbi:hypothetical protein [Streptomyces avermitilis]|uniref:hypothetical protein n=1 Tax=Streptomyces avermitilis TaxID=33903 RepID=UPI003716119A
MQTFTSTELNRKSGTILQAAREQGSVEIRKGSEVYVLQYVRTDEDATTYVRNDAVRTEGDPWKDEMLSLMRELVEQGRGVSGGDDETSQTALVADCSKVTVPADEPEPRTVRIPVPPMPKSNPESENAANARLLERSSARRQERMEAAFKAAHSRPVPTEPEPVESKPVVIPETVKAPEPEKPGEPTQDELTAAYEYLGLQEDPDGLSVTQRGIQSALGTVRKIARQDPESAEAKVMKMGAADEERVEFLLCVQVDKLSKALAKRAAGDPRWLGAGTP